MTSNEEQHHDLEVISVEIQGVRSQMRTIQWLLGTGGVALVAMLGWISTVTMDNSTSIAVLQSNAFTHSDAGRAALLEQEARNNLQSMISTNREEISRTSFRVDTLESRLPQ